MVLSDDDRGELARGLVLTGFGIALIAVGYFVVDPSVEGLAREFIAGALVILGIVTVFVSVVLLVIPPLLPQKPLQ